MVDRVFAAYIDLIKSVGGVDYTAALPEVVTVDVDGMLIPFVSPRLFWRMDVGACHRRDPTAVRLMTRRGIVDRTKPTMWPTTSAAAMPRVNECP